MTKSKRLFLASSLVVLGLSLTEWPAGFALGLIVVGAVWGLRLIISR